MYSYYCHDQFCLGCVLMPANVFVHVLIVMCNKYIKPLASIVLEWLRAPSTHDAQQEKGAQRKARPSLSSLLAGAARPHSVSGAG